VPPAWAAGTAARAATAPKYAGVAHAGAAVDARVVGRSTGEESRRSAAGVADDDGAGVDDDGAGGIVGASRGIRFDNDGRRMVHSSAAVAVLPADL
jgi:hypothetical protein